jgi:hypothetical protein
MDNSQDHAQMRVGDIIDRFIRWWYRPSRAELEQRIQLLGDQANEFRNMATERWEQLCLLRTEHEALKMEIEAAKRAYSGIRRDVPHRILEGKDPAAVHEARREYENNRLRVFVNQTHRSATALLDAIATLNKDLQKAKTAVAGGLLQDEPANPG